MNNLFNLDGRVAIVTGGDKGIGRAIADALASAGANIVIAARNKIKMTEATQEIQKSHGVRVLAVETDVIQEGQIYSMVSRANDTFGKIDILVNNAGISEGKKPMDISVAEFDRVINTNLRACFISSKAVYPHMQAAKGGKIINIGSIASNLGSAFLAAYSSSKGGIIQLTRSLAVAWAADNIQVNSILPGWYKTDLGGETRGSDPSMGNYITSLTPMGRYGELPELGGAAIFLSSQASSFVTGVALTVDGGYSIALRGLEGPFRPPLKHEK